MKIVERYNDSQLEGIIISIVEAKYIGDFAIRLNFNDGHMQLVDFKPFMEKTTHPDIKKYYNEEYFKDFQIIDGNLDWNDFELCFPIGDLYENNILKRN